MERHDELVTIEPVQCEQHLFLARPVMVVFFLFHGCFHHCPFQPVAPYRQGGGNAPWFVCWFWQQIVCFCAYL